MKQKLIVPKPGMIIPLPSGNGNLPANGKVLTLSTYWYKREADGDVTFEDPPAPQPSSGEGADGRKGSDKPASKTSRK